MVEYLHIKIRDSLAGFNNYKQRYDYTTWSAVTNYNQNAVVQEGTDYYISLTNSNLGNQPSLDTAQSNWSKIYDYDLPQETQKDDIDVWRGQMIPDLDLHPYNIFCKDFFWGFFWHPGKLIFKLINPCFNGSDPGFMGSPASIFNPD